jgi:hypothetical protein
MQLAGRDGKQTTDMLIAIQRALDASCRARIVTGGMQPKREMVDYSPIACLRKMTVDCNVGAHHRSDHR